MRYVKTKRKALSLGVLGGLVVLLLSIGVVLAAGETLPRTLVSSGGGPLSGEGLNLHSAVGQPVAGPVSNGLNLCSGYLCGSSQGQGDDEPPSVVATNPSDGASDVPRNAPIVIDFSEAMDTGSLSYAISPTVTGLAETWSAGDTRLTLAHDDLAAGADYTVTVDAGADPAGNPLVNAPYTWSFNTGAQIVPEADLALGKERVGTGDVIAGGTITYTLTLTNNGPTTPVTATLVDGFSNPSALAGVSGPGCQWAPGSAEVTCTVSDLALGSPVNLTLVVTTDEAYQGTLSNSALVEVETGILDPNPSNDGAGPVSVSLVSEGGDTTPPSVTATSPGDGATLVLPDAPIVIDFGEAMDTGSLSYAITPTVTGLGETWSNGDARLTLAHDELAAETGYTVTVGAGTDLAGNPLANAPYAWSFSTRGDSAPTYTIYLPTIIR